MSTSRLGEKGPPPAGAAEAVPTSFSAADREPSPLVSCCLPQLGSPRPLRGELLIDRPRDVKAAQVVVGQRGGALVLALTSVVDLMGSPGRQLLLYVEQDGNVGKMISSFTCFLQAGR